MPRWIILITVILGIVFVYGSVRFLGADPIVCEIGCTYASCREDRGNDDCPYCGCIDGVCQE